jgi:hypothetical protein
MRAERAAKRAHSALAEVPDDALAEVVAA